MSKNIPKTIVRIGYSTKKNISGKLSFEIDGNKLKNMDVLQVGEIIAILADLQTEVLKATNNNFMVGNHTLSPDEYNTIERFIYDNKILAAVKAYKECTGVGLKEAKESIMTLKTIINKHK